MSTVRARTTGDSAKWSGDRWPLFEVGNALSKRVPRGRPGGPPRAPCGPRARSKRGGFRRGGRGGVNPFYRIIGLGDFFLTQPSTRLMTQRVGGFLKPICILVSAEVVEELGQICKFRI